MKNLVAVVKAPHTSPRVGKNGSSYSKGNSGKGNNSQSRDQYTQAGQRGKDTNKQYQCQQCGEVGHLRRECPSLKDKGLSQREECRSSPQGLKKHSPNKQASIGVKSVTKEGVTGDDLVEQKGPAHMGVWEKLVGRANEEKIFINGLPLTTLLGTGSQVTNVSHDLCVANGIEINPIAKLVNIEGTGGNSIEYLGCAEASLSLPMGSHTFKTEALLLVLPTTDYLKKVPVSIGTTITDMVVNFINQHKPDNMSKSWKVECCATHTRKLVQSQPISKRAIKTTKPVTLPPFSTTVVKGNTKFRSHGMS